MYQIRIYFYAEGEEEKKELLTLRDRLVELQGKSLQQVQTALGIESLVRRPSKDDVLSEVTTSLTTQRLKNSKDGKFTSFHVELHTEYKPNFAPLAALMSQKHPRISAEYMGDGNGQPMSGIIWAGAYTP